MNQVYHYKNSLRIEIINNNLFLIKDETSGLVAIGEDPKKLLLELVNKKDTKDCFSNPKRNLTNKVMLTSKHLLFKLTIFFSTIIILALIILQLMIELKKIEPILDIIKDKDNHYSFKNLDNDLNIQEYFMNENGNFRIKAFKILNLALERLNYEYKNLPEEKKENLRRQVAELVANYEDIVSLSHPTKLNTPAISSHN